MTKMMRKMDGYLLNQNKLRIYSRLKRKIRINKKQKNPNRQKKKVYLPKKNSNN